MPSTVSAAPLLVRVTELVPTLFVELKYAGADNFMGRPVYDFQDAYLRPGTARRLARAQQALLAEGRCLKIWDAWRPLSAQFKMWEFCPNDDYVADPTRGGCSNHNRGSAVDVTLVRTDGSPLPMPTAFDQFEANPNRDYDRYSPEAAANARLLERAMREAGFVPYENEWWHFNDRDRYPVAEGRLPSAAPRELWDAVDREDRPLGFDLVRGDPIPEGVCHRVVFVFTVTDRGNILLTRRHPDKPFGLMWEVTGGSVLKGESPVRAAVRELWEETGLSVSPAELRLVYTHVWPGIPAVYHAFAARVPEAGLSVRLQPGETVEWTLLPYGQFKQRVRDGAYPMFPAPFCRRFLDFEPAFDRALTP